MEAKSNKKNLTIVVIVLAVIVIGSGAYYGYNRWQQQRLVNAYYQALYGTSAPGIAGLVGSTGGLLGGVPGGLSADAMKELANLQAEEEAKQEVQNAADEAKEAAKTPRDKYNEAEVAYLSGNVSPLFDQVARSNVEAVFGECKIVSSTFGYGVGGFVVQIMVPEKVTAEKFDQLVQKFTDQGYTSAYGEITADAGMMMLEKDDGSTVFTFNFDAESDEQGIAIMYSVNE